MSRAKLFMFSVIGGIVIAIVLTAIAFSVDNKKVSGALLWQDTLFVYLTGPGPLLFIDEQGKPHYEGTPILLLILPVGFLLSIPIYSVPSYLFLRWLVRGRSAQG